MSEPILISPLLDGFVMGDPISSHDGVRACPAMLLENEKKYIVKIISHPATQSKLEALLLAGAFADRESALDYFKELIGGVVEEVQLLQKLARNEGFVAFDDWQLVPMENDETGYDLYLLGQYRPTLENLLRGNEMTHLQGINLGLDLCSALCLARRFGYLYSNLRPSNVFICNEREFRIGDVGFIRLDDLHFASLPDQYRSIYTAPEISDAFSALNLTMDTYAAGLILYQVYNDGQLPAADQPLAAPRHADAALSEIILKAIAVNPDDRWQDPMQMGQALAGYMQTNAVNETPIAPPAPAEEDEPEEILPEVDDEPSTADILAEVDDALDAVAAMIPIPEVTAEAMTHEEEIAEETAEPSAEEPYDEDSTEEIPISEAGAEAPAINAVPAETEEVEAAQEDAQEMLAQADDLIAYRMPEPSEPQEPAEVSLPIPEETQEPEQPAGEDIPEDIPTTTAETAPSEPDDKPIRRQHKCKGLTIACILVAIALFLITGVTIFYQNYYLQTIDDLIVTGKEDTLTVQLVTEIPDEKLSVKCTDPHGNSLTSSVVDGIASFEGLKPDTSYTVEVFISGTHKLLGEIKESYSTGSATVISGFYATTGLEDGAVILYFTAQGPEAPQWTITYWAEGEEARATEPFNSHQYTLNGLKVGKKYTFRLLPTQELYISGTNEITYTVSGVIYPENVRAIGFTEQGLGITWNVPAGITVENWSIRCYNDAGYDETIISQDTTVYFDGLDMGTDYTVEVKAEGMSLGTRIFISANAVTIQQLQIDDSTPGSLKVSWQPDGDMPASGWLLLYTIDNSTTQQVITCDDNFCEINLRIPGAHYSFRIKAADGSSVFGGELEYDAPAAEPFSGFLVTADNMTFSMCKTPSKTGWTYEDVAASDYTTSFVLGQSAAFVAHLDTKTSKVDDVVTTLYVIHDYEGHLISAKTESQTWDDMWDNRYGEFVIPVMPDDAGSYTVSIYFNGAAVCTQTFSIGAHG